MRRTGKSGTSIIVTNTLYCWGQHSRHHSFFQLLYNSNCCISFLFLKEKKIPNTPAADTVGRPHWTNAKRNCNSVGIIAIGENTNRFNKVMIWGYTHMGRETWTKGFLTQGQFYCQSWKKDLVVNFDPHKTLTSLPSLILKPTLRHCPHWLPLWQWEWHRVPKRWEWWAELGIAWTHQYE